MATEPLPSWGTMWAKWLHKPCHFGDPQCGNKTKNGYITPLVLGGWCGQNGYKTLAILGSPMWGQHQKWLHNSCRLGGHMWAR